MIDKDNELRIEIIDKVIKLVNEKLPAEEAPLVEKFIREYYASVSYADLKNYEDIDLYGSALSHWRFMQNRRKGEIKLHVYNPRFDQHGWQSTHTVIEIISDDIPFLIDSIRMELTRMGINIHLIVHFGGLQVKRDSKSNINSLAIGSEEKPSEDALIEAPIRFEVDRQNSEKKLAAIEKNLARVLNDVKLAVRDWKKMCTRVGLLVNDLKAGINGTDSASSCDKYFTNTALPVNKKESAEVLDFLEWIGKGNFTFLGSRFYKFTGKEGNEKLEPIAGTSLGVMQEKDREEDVRYFEELTKEARKYLLSSNLLIISQTSTNATVHRPTNTYSIEFRFFDNSKKLLGSCRFIGLFTAVAYNYSPQQIPLLDAKVASILNKSALSPRGHSGKELLNIIENLPRDDLFTSNADDIYELAIGILHLQERQRIRLFVLKDILDRYYSCLVYVPRELFNSKLRQKIQSILLEELNGEEATFATRFSESVLARIHFKIKVDRKKIKPYNIEEIENKLVEAGRIWEDDLRAALHDAYGEERANVLFKKYGNMAFPVSYQETFVARNAMFDIEHMESLTGPDMIAMSFYRSIEEKEALRFKLFRFEQPIPLSEVVHTLENMGVKVISERVHKVTLQHCTIWMNDFAMLHGQGSELNADAVKEIFQEAFARIWRGDAENDGYNQLILAARLSWREISILRAYQSYLWQTGFTFGKSYVEETLVKHPEISRKLIAFFKLKFTPNKIKNREEKLEEVQKDLEGCLEAVDNIDEDKILRRFIEVIVATQRTNYFCDNNGEGFKSYISFKLNPKKIPEIPKPLPAHEIYVYSPRVEGVHLRGGDVARGGLRWSDRPQDYRTEILGLMKAQQVKNAVIVPLGAKGGFVAKNLPKTGDRDEIFEEVVICYKTFIRGILDLTDNIVDFKVKTPRNVITYDKEDPYMVVAADKGTATFSDTANEISNEYGFWLGDAFASGGSAGYDHKKMGITAKGAWESVKHHFKRLGIDTQSQDFTVVGIGDMAGDVFGNGMLLSEHIRLIGAFNHRHIFIDPEPDAQASYKERVRLFNLPRSSWSDYNPKLISKGGGVFDRSSKWLRLTPEIKKLLNIKQDRVQPNDLMRALLTAKVDLLFNGGIGTFVKAETELHTDVGDKTNDAIRVNGKDLRCKVVGEGGNLGFTQLGRVEFAMKGGMLNTDAIDNAAGVNCSDHEVNIKILLDDVVTSGDMTSKQRNKLLADMTDEVAELVLITNKRQAEAISMEELQAADNVEMHIRLLKDLEERGKLDRQLEFLPSKAELLDRKNKGTGLTRPELSVLLGYMKTILKQELLKYDIPEDSHLSLQSLNAFPKALRQKYKANIKNHRLRREIITTQISNRIYNDMGISFIKRVQDETGATVAEIVRCYWVAKEVFEAQKIRDEIMHYTDKTDVKLQIRMLQELNRLLRRGTRWFLRNYSGNLDIDEVVEKYHDGVDKVRSLLNNYTAGTTKTAIEKLAQELAAAGVPEDLAYRVGGMSAMFSALDIVAASSSIDCQVDKVTQVYFAVGARLRLGWFREQVKLRPVNDHWDAMARAAFRDDLDRQQRNLTISVLGLEIEETDVEARIDYWQKKNEIFAKRWMHLIEELGSVPQPEFIMFAVALRELLYLSHGGTAVTPASPDVLKGKKEGDSGFEAMPAVN